jgi:hypothetical protein
MCFAPLLKKEYMEKEGTEFSILATLALPDDALNFTAWRENILVVKLDYVEVAYIFLRELLQVKTQLKDDYALKVSQLQVKDQVVRELSDFVTSGQLDQLINAINDAAGNIENSVAKLENYVLGYVKATRSNSDKIQKITALLVTQYAHNS